MNAPKKYEGEIIRSPASGWVVSGKDRYEMTARTIILTNSFFIIEGRKGKSRIEIPLEDIGMAATEGFFAGKLMIKEKGDYKGKYVFEVGDAGRWVEELQSAIEKLEK